ncbi:hypothetical protein D3C80_2167040 [compost metagenome]
MHRHLAAQLVLQRLQAFQAAPGEHQRPAVGGETPRRGATETGGGAGDEDDLAHLQTSCCDYMN